MTTKDKFDKVNNISSLPPVTDAVIIEKEVGITSTGYLDDLPIEDDVDLELEAIANREARHKRERGYRMFREGKSLEAIAMNMEINEFVVHKWAKDGKWEARLREQNNTNEGLVYEKVRQVRLKHAEKEAQESIELSEQLRRSVRARLNEDELINELPEKERLEMIKLGARIGPMGLKNLADAAKASGDLGNYGMGTANQKDERNEKRPLVMVVNGGQGGLPGIKLAEGTVGPPPGK